MSRSADIVGRACLAQGLCRRMVTCMMSASIMAVVTIQAREEILRQTTEDMRRQDASLIANQRNSSALAAGFIPVGTLVAALLAFDVVEAERTQVIAAVAIALMIVATNTLCWIGIHLTGRQLAQGPDIGDLMRQRNNNYSALLDHLITTLGTLCTNNRASARSAYNWVRFQAVTNLGCVCGFVTIVLLFL